MTRRVLGGLGALLLVGAAACGAEPASHGDPDRGGLPTIRSLDDIVLPLDHYDLAPRDHYAVVTAREELTAQCMAEQGYPGFPVMDWSHRLDLPVHAFSGLPLVDLDDAREHGLLAGWQVGFAEKDNAASQAALPELDTPEARLALYGRTARRLPAGSDGFEVPETGGGCDAEGHRRLYGLVGEKPPSPVWLDDLIGKSIWKVAADPRLDGPWQAWSACMKQRGFDYPTWGDVGADPRWAAEGADTRAVAVAYVECIHESRAVDTWVALAAAEQERVIEENAEALEHYRDTVHGVVEAIREQGLGNVGPHPAG